MPAVRQRQYVAPHGFVEILELQGSEGRYPGFDDPHPRYVAHLPGHGFRCPPQACENLGEAVIGVKLGPAGAQGIQRGKRHHDRAQPGRDHQGYGQGLATQAPEVAEQFAIQCAEHHWAAPPPSPADVAGGYARLVDTLLGHSPVPQPDHPVGHVRDFRVMRNQRGERAQFAIHAFERLENHDARA